MTSSNLSKLDGSTNFQCIYCDKIFKFTGTLTKHMKKIHNVNNPRFVEVITRVIMA